MAWLQSAAIAFPLLTNLPGPVGSLGAGVVNAELIAPMWQQSRALFYMADGSRPGGAEMLIVDEHPCSVIRSIAVEATPPQDREEYAWLASKLGGDEGLDGPVGRCVGARGLGQLLQRARQALQARGFTSVRVMLPAQDLSAGTLTLTVLPRPPQEDPEPQSDEKGVTPAPPIIPLPRTPRRKPVLAHASPVEEIQNVSTRG